MEIVMSDAEGQENKVHYKVYHKVYHGMGTMFYNNPSYCQQELAFMSAK